jgi:hypothetical protein
MRKGKILFIISSLITYLPAALPYYRIEPFFLEKVYSEGYDMVRSGNFTQSRKERNKGAKKIFAPLLLSAFA